MNYLEFFCIGDLSPALHSFILLYTQESLFRTWDYNPILHFVALTGPALVLALTIDSPFSWFLSPFDTPCHCGFFL